MHEPIDILAEVGLVQQDNRRRPAVPGESEVPLDPAHVRAPAAVERAHNEDRVHVSRQYLFVGTTAGKTLPAPGGLAGEPASLGQYLMDSSFGFPRMRYDHNPVADCRKTAAYAGLVPESAGHLSLKQPRFSEHLVRAPVLQRHPARD
jgi:hypothetical protein